MRMLAALLGVWLGSIHPAAAENPEPPKIRVAIVPGIAVNLDASRVDALGQDLADALASELVVEAVGGLEVRRQLPAAGLPPDCVATPACIADVAKRLRATQLLFVVVVDTGGTVQIDSTWIDVATGTSESRPAIELATVADAKAKLASSAVQLLPNAPVRPRPNALDGRMTPAVPRHVTMPAMVAAAAGVVGLGIGIGFGLSARSGYNDCDTARDTCSSDARSSIRTRALVADLGWAVAIGGAATAVILFATSSEKPRLIVEPSPSGVAVSAAGTF